MPASRPTGPSCFDRMKSGALIGCAVGLSAGALFGTFGALRFVQGMCSITELYWCVTLDTDYEEES